MTRAEEAKRDAPRSAVCGPERGWRGADPQVSPSMKTTAPGNLAEVQRYCRPGGTLARAADPGGPTEAGETQRYPRDGEPANRSTVGGRQGAGLACARAGAAGGQREHVPPAPLFLQASPLGALKVSRLRPWKEEAEAELLGPRLPGQTSGLPVSVAGCRPGQGQGPRDPVLLFLSSGPHIGVTTEGLTQPETCGCESNPGGPGSLAGDIHLQHGQQTGGHLNASPRTQQLSKLRATCP